MLMNTSAADGTRTRGLRRDRPGYHTPASAYQPFSAAPAGLDSRCYALLPGDGPQFRATNGALTLHVSRRLAAIALEILMGGEGVGHGQA